MKKIFGKSILLFLMLAVSGGITSCTPKANSEVKLSLASTTTTDRGDVKIQKNIEKPQNNSTKKQKKKSFTDVKADDIENSNENISYTILQKSALSFDLAISGLSEGEFDIKIKKIQNGKESEDVSSKFLWVYHGDGGVYIKALAPQITDEEETSEYEYMRPIWSDTPYRYNLTYHYTQVILNENTDDEIEYRIYRIQAPDNLDFNTVKLKVTVSQNLDTSVQKGVSNSIRGSMFIDTFDFITDYSSLVDPEHPEYGQYTDLNNISVKITSDFYDVEYSAPEAEITEDGYIKLSINDHPMIPYKSITIRYREKGSKEEWIVVEDYVVVFPHIGNINSKLLQFPNITENPEYKIAMGGEGSTLYSSRVGVIENNTEVREDSYRTLIPYINFNWTGKDQSFKNNSLVLADGTDRFTFGLAGGTAMHGANYGFLSDNYREVYLDDFIGSNFILEIDNVKFGLGEYTGTGDDIFNRYFFTGTDQQIFK